MPRKFKHKNKKHIKETPIKSEILSFSFREGILFVVFWSSVLLVYQMIMRMFIPDFVLKFQFDCD